MGKRLRLKYRHETFGDNAVEGFFSAKVEGKEIEEIFIQLLL